MTTSLWSSFVTVSFRLPSTEIQVAVVDRRPQPLCAAAIVYFCKDCEASELFASVDCAERQRDRCGRKAEPVVVLQGGP